MNFPSRRERIAAQLADLKMPGALEALDGVLSGVDGGGTTASEAIERLLAAQIALRNSRRLEAAMRSSRLPAIKTLAEFDFSFQPSIKREQIDSLHELGFVERRENIVFLGPPGVGKTHLAISLAIAAAESGRRVYYGTLVDLIDSLEEAKAGGRLNHRLKTLTYPALLVVDEIGYLPIGQSGAVLFFQLVNRRYERASTVLTSNKGFEEWGQILGDEVMAAALLDRILHRCHIVNIRGNSYRCAATPSSPGRSIRPLPERSAHGIRSGKEGGMRGPGPVAGAPVAVAPLPSRGSRDVCQFSVAKSVQFSMAIDIDAAICRQNAIERLHVGVGFRADQHTNLVRHGGIMPVDLVRQKPLVSRPVNHGRGVVGRGQSATKQTGGAVVQQDIVELATQSLSQVASQSIFHPRQPRLVLDAPEK